MGSTTLCFLWNGLLIGGEDKGGPTASVAALANAPDKSFLGLLAKGDARGFGGGVEVLVAGLGCSGTALAFAFALAPRLPPLATALGLDLLLAEPVSGPIAAVAFIGAAELEATDSAEPPSPSPAPHNYMSDNSAASSVCDP